MVPNRKSTKIQKRHNLATLNGSRIESQINYLFRTGCKFCLAILCILVLCHFYWCRRWCDERSKQGGFRVKFDAYHDKKALYFRNNPLDCFLKLSGSYSYIIYVRRTSGKIWDDYKYLFSDVIQSSGKGLSDRLDCFETFRMLCLRTREMCFG